MILPRRNELDLEEVPEELRKEMRFIPVDTIDEVLREALTPPSESQIQTMTRAA